MSKGKHSEAEMIGALKQLEAGRRAEDVGREMGVSKHTIYAWKAKYGGLDVNEAQRLRQLEDENHRLKKLVADLSLDKEMLKAVISSQQRVCGLMQIAVSSFRYRATRSDEVLRERLVELARKKPRWGYRRLHVLLGCSGERVNHKRVFRVYREAGLAVRRKARKRLMRDGSPRPQLTAANQEWAADFAHDAMASGRAIRVLSVVDECTRECLTLEVDTSFASRRVTRALELVLSGKFQRQAAG